MDLDHFDAGLSEVLVRECVAFVGDDDARFKCHDVVAVVPLLASCGEIVSTCPDHANVLEFEGIGHCSDEAFGSLIHNELVRGVARPDAPHSRLIDDGSVCGHRVPVYHCYDGVEMH